MLRCSWALAVLGVLSIAVVPAFAQGGATYNRDTVKALSKRIDEHLARAWKKAGVTPAPKAEEHIFFRRLHLDLVGRIPDLLKIHDFVDPSNDSPYKRWDSVDTLLDGPEHSKHFANVWR